MPSEQRSCWIESQGDAAVLHLGGVWRLPQLRTLEVELGALHQPLRESLAGAPALAVEGGALSDIDTAAALLHHYFYKDNTLVRMLPGK